MDFIDFARACGLVINDLQVSNKIRRCPTKSHPHSKNGSYFYNGEFGWVKNWEDGDEMRVYRSSEKIEPIKIIKHDYSKRHAEAAQDAEKLIKAAKSKTHYYLNSKGFRDALGLVCEDIELGPMLLIPMRDFYTNEMLGVQKIHWEAGKYHKRMISGMRAKGAVFFMGAQSSKDYYLCEGYATGLSISKAIKSLNLDACVVVCFSASNLVHVGGLIWDKNLYVYADNDKSCAGEQAAKKLGCRYVMSKKLGNDANDDMMDFGLDEVCKKILEVKQ